VALKRIDSPIEKQLQATTLHLTYPEAHLKILIIAILSLILSACGGGDSSKLTQATSGTGSSTPFALASVTPQDGSNNVARSDALVASFNSDLSSLNDFSTTVQLIGPEGNTIPVSASPSGGTLSLHGPGSALPGDTRYTIRLSSDIIDVSNRKLGNIAQSTFVTSATQHWDDQATSIGTMSNFPAAHHPAISVDPAGNVIATWSYLSSSTSTDVQIFAARLNAVSGQWENATHIYTISASTAYDAYLIGSVEVLAAANGNLHLLWAKSSNSSTTYFHTRYVASTGNWSEPAAIYSSTVGGSSAIPSYAIDATGNVFFLLNNLFGGVLVSRFDSKSATWSMPNFITSKNVVTSYQRVITGANSTAIAIWGQSDGLYLSRYDSGKDAWGTPKLVDAKLSPSDLVVYSARFDTNGVATMVWTHRDGIWATPSINTARYDANADALSAVTRLDRSTNASGAKLPEVVVDAAGYATAAWFQSEGYYAARFNPASNAWSSPQLIASATSTLFMADVPKLVVDLVGNVYASFLLETGATVTQFTTTDSNWHVPVNVDTSLPAVSGAYSSPQLATDLSGNITAIWLGQIGQGTSAGYVIARNQFR